MFNTVSRLRREEGFTLIELMIVVVVLGILAGLVLLAVNGFQDSAQTAKENTDKDTCKTYDAAIAAGANASNLLADSGACNGVSR